jgi:hypothetical protein
MRYVDRAVVDAPPSLSAPSDAVREEKIAAVEFYRTFDTSLNPRPKAYAFVHYKDFDVTSRLRRLFHDKCAYCESDVGDDMDVEHFRPKGGVTGDRTHPGYWWLAHTWENLLPSCTPCNQSRRQHIASENLTEAQLLALRTVKPKTAYGKANQFPIEGPRAYPGGVLANERAHLLDPTHDNPAEYLLWSQSGTYSVVLANPNDHWSRKRAISTISVFALNRLRLVQSRTKTLNQLRYQAERTLQELEEDMAAGASPRLVERALKRVEEMRLLQAADMPYSAMVKSYIDKFVIELHSMIAR